MSASKRPSTSSLRRFITSRPFVTVAELRRRFGLDEPDAMALLRHNGTSAWIGLPEREATKLQDLWDRNELGVELSVEVRAPVAVGVYPMRIARYVTEGLVNGNGNGNGNGVAPRPDTSAAATASSEHSSNGDASGHGGGSTVIQTGRDVSSMDHPGGRGDDGSNAHPHAPRPMPGAPSYGTPDALPLKASREQPRG